MQSRNEVGILQTKRLLIEPMSRAAFLRALGDETYSAQEHAVYAELEERYQADSRNRFSFFTNRLIRRRSDGVTVGSIAYMSGRFWKLAMRRWKYSGDGGMQPRLWSRCAARGCKYRAAPV